MFHWYANDVAIIGDTEVTIPSLQFAVFARRPFKLGAIKRELYTDDEDVIYNFIRCIGINGINIGGLKPDLLDRSINT